MTDSNQVSELLSKAQFYALQQGNFIAAEQCFSQALQQSPNNAEALAGLGQCLCWRNHNAEGRRLLVKAAKQLLRKPDKSRAKALLALSEQLQHLGELDSAHQLARTAVQFLPGSAAAYHNLAACLHRMNQLKQAITHAQKACQLATINDASGSIILLAIIEIELKDWATAQLRLEKLLETEHDPEQRARACLELAKVYDKQHRYGEAFDLMSQGGELSRQLPAIQQFDADFIFQQIEAYKKGFDKTLLQRWSILELNDALPMPVFIVGFLRSGTTLTEQVLSAHTNVLTSDENSLIQEVIREMERITELKGDVPGALRRLDKDDTLYLRQFYWRRVAEEYGPQVLTLRFINKVALNSIEIGFISTLFPDARIIFALRDPRDICISCAQQAFTISAGTVNLLSWKGIATQYAAVMDLWLNLRDHIQPVYLELRYEDTVLDFETSFKRVFNLLALDWTEEVTRFHEKTTGRFIATPSFSAVTQPLYASALGRWQGYTEYFDALEPILEPYIKAFGYETTK